MWSWTFETPRLRSAELPAKQNIYFRSLKHVTETPFTCFHRDKHLGPERRTQTSQVHLPHPHQPTPYSCTEQARRSEGEAPGACCAPRSALPPGSSTHTSIGGSFTEGNVDLLMEPFGPFEIGIPATLYHKQKSAEPRTQSRQAGPLPPFRGSVARPGTCSV